MVHTTVKTQERIVRDTFITLHMDKSEFIFLERRMQNVCFFLSDEDVDSEERVVAHILDDKVKAHAKVFDYSVTLDLIEVGYLLEWLVGVAHPIADRIYTSLKQAIYVEVK